MRLTLLSDDSVSGTLGKVLGLSGLDLGFTGIVSLLSVLGEDGRLGGSSDGLVLRLRRALRDWRYKMNMMRL
jgi:hypothetical protein